MSYTRSVSKVFDDFDPSTKSREVYATYCDGRRPAFKIHATTQGALATITQWNNCMLYQHVGDEWKLVIRKCYHDKRERCDHCHGSTVENDRYTGKEVDAGVFTWVKEKGKIKRPLEMLFVCKACWSLYA